MTTMIRHLVRDARRRYVPVYLVIGGFLSLVWLIMIVGGLAPSAALAFSLAGAWFFGVFAGVGLFSSREIVLLPIPRRGLWRAQWIVATLVATSATTTAKLAGALIPGLFGRGPDFPFIALSSCLDFLYNGALLAIVAVTGVAGGRISQDAPFIKRSVQASGIFVALMGGFAWGFALRPILPTTWTEVTGATAMAMGAALVVSLAVFFYRPPADQPRPGRARREIPRHDDRVRSHRPGRLVGIPKLIADDLKWTAALTAMLPAAIAAAYIGVHAFNPAPGDSNPLEALMKTGLLPLRGDAPFDDCSFLMFLGFGLINNRAFRGVDPVSSILRQLRVMPLGVGQLNALLVGRRLLGWLVVWLFFFIAHIIVFQSVPSTLRLDILLWVAAGDSLIYALHLCWMNWLAMLAFAMTFSKMSALVIDDLSGAGIAPVAVVAIGLACLSAAVWINHTTLTWRQKPYRPMAPPPIAKGFGRR